MIDEKKMIKKLQDRIDDFTKQHPDQKNCEQIQVQREFIHELKLAVAENNSYGWMPISESVPDSDRYILISFSNYPVPCVGRYEENEDGGAFYVDDDDKPLIKYGVFVNAWMELPKSYKEGLEKEQ